jgi:uncharacterized protein YbbC (DUF1343 family)/beta-glucosidase-like glycosyl hydrolase
MNKCLTKILMVIRCILFFIVLLTTLLIPHNQPIGQRFILSLPKTHDKKILASWLTQTKPAGVMLEAWHMSDRLKIKDTISYLQLTAKNNNLPPLFITIDWEGGIVARAHEGGDFFSVPAPYNLCQGGRSSCFLAGMLIGKQLHDIGINVSFAPSLDLFAPHNYILATRCFASNPLMVFNCGLAFARGLLSVGVMPVIKHFPGLGDGTGDTHLCDVKINDTTKKLKKHLYPFIKALKAKLPAIMVSHAEYQQFGNKPASQSTTVAKFLNHYNPNALLITDDISMMAFNKIGTPCQSLTLSPCFIDAIETSLSAGFHLLIFSAAQNDQEFLLKTLEAHESIAALTTHDTFVQKINETKKHILQSDKKVFFSSLDGEQLANELSADGNKKHIWVKNIEHKKILLLSVNLPKIRPSEAWFIDGETSYLGSLLKSDCAQLHEIIYDAHTNQSIEFFKKTARLAKEQKYDSIIVQTFFYGQGLWNKNQEELLKLLTPQLDRLVVFSLGHPYEKIILGKEAAIINLGAFHKPDIGVAYKRLLTPPLITGADRLMQNPGPILNNKRIGLLCHNCSWIGIGKEKEFLADAIFRWTQQQNNNSRLCALFCPEHGLQGTQEAASIVNDISKSQWGCPIYSLHGKLKSPTDQMLKNIDVIVIDLQDVGVRCYTYLSSMVLMIEAAAKNNVEVVVLERPNPLKSLSAQGPMLEPSCMSFAGKIAVPFLHGQTIGSLAKLVNEKYHAKLTVIECIGDTDIFFRTNFQKPSPNLPSYTTLFTYPMTVVIEGTNYSEGRGTQNPFQQIGAPWVNAQLLAKTLNKQDLSGVYFEPCEFIPKKIIGCAENPKHKNQLCKGVFIHVINKKIIRPVAIAQILLTTLFELYPQQSQLVKWGKTYSLDGIIGTSTWRKKLLKSKNLLV